MQGCSEPLEARLALVWELPGRVGKQLPRLPLSRVTSALALARVLLCVFSYREGQSTKKEGESTRERQSLSSGVNELDLVQMERPKASDF